MPNNGYSVCRNCKVSNFTSAGITVQPYDVAINCEVTGGTTAATCAVSVTGGIVRDCYIHDGACPGIILSAFTHAFNNIIVNNTGASSDGIRVNYGSNVVGNTIFGNGRHGINVLINYMICNIWRGNILAGNGGYGLLGSSSAAFPLMLPMMATRITAIHQQHAATSMTPVPYLLRTQSQSMPIHLT